MNDDGGADRADDEALALAAAILDGDAVAWDSLPIGDDSGTRSFLRQLRLIAAVADTHRQADLPAEKTWRHLEIVERLGAGTFGEVYRAHDTVLRRDVALKLAPAGTDVGALDEGRALARVRHPNVVIVHGAGEDHGRSGIWMEMIHGRTLCDIVTEHGPLPAEDAVAIGASLCSAVAAVHRAGLLHGDIKPQNVMREPDGRIVLMDFGTSRITQRSDKNTPLTGTPLYLPPEVLCGEIPDARADVYSLGALLYYLLTGRTPVEGRTLNDVRSAHRANASVSVRDRGHVIPAAIADAIDRATADDLQTRFPTIDAFADALGAGRKPESPRFSSWRFPALAALLVLAVAGLLRLGASGTTPDDRQQPILVAAFENHTGDTRLDEALRVALQQELMQSRRLTIVPDERVADTLQLMRRAPGERLAPAVAREVAVRDGGISLVASGSVERVGSLYRLNVRVDDIRTGSAIFHAGTNAGAPDELLAAISDLGARIRTAVGESRTQVQNDAALARVTTRSLDALHAYTQGLALVNAAKWQAAELPLREAVRLDPGFASAEVMLAHCIRNQRRPPAEYLPVIDRAFAQSEGLPERERYFIAGTYHDMHGEPGKAAAALEVLVREFPDDFWAVNNLLHLYAQLGRHRDTAVMAEQRARLRPHNFVAQIGNAERIVITGMGPARARTIVDHAASLDMSSASSHPNGPHYLAWIRLFPVFEHWAAGRIEQAATTLDRFPVNSGLELGDATTGLMELTLGRIRAAEAAFGRMPPHSIRQPLLAYAALARGDRTGAVAALRADPRLFDGAVPAPGAGAYGWTTLVYDTMLRTGLVNEAEAYGKRVIAGRPEWWSGRLAAARGDVDEAIRLLAPLVAVLEPGLPPTLMAVNALADAYVKRGQLEMASALLRQFEPARATAYPAGGSRGLEWLRSRARAAAVHRHLGNASAAEAVELELREALRFADPDFVLMPESR